jgi:hypothetical protein
MAEYIDVPTFGTPPTESQPQGSNCSPAGVYMHQARKYITWWWSDRRSSQIIHQIDRLGALNI